MPTRETAPAETDALTDFTMALGAAARCVSTELGGPPLCEGYIRELAATLWTLWVQPVVARADYLAGEYERVAAELDDLTAAREELRGMPAAGTAATLAAIGTERARQRAKHGDFAPDSPTLTDTQRLVMLVEEVGEIAHALTYDGDPAAVQTEVTQFTAIGMGWLDQLATYAGQVRA